MDNQIEDTSHLKGVVIITLPPPHDPSLPKTITAFTIPLTNPPQLPNPHRQNPSPLDLNSNRSSSIGLKRSFLYNPRALLLFLGASLFVYFFLKSPFAKTLEEFRQSREDESERRSYLLPLYRKGSVGGVLELGDLEVKLGRFKDVVEVKRELKLGASLSVADKSAIFPVRGNVYPDGLYFTYMLVGDPPRPYFLDVDTGSDLTWIQCDAPCTSCAKGAHPLYKPIKRNIVPYKDSLCTEVQRNQQAGHCTTCQQCDYEIQYADHSSSIGVLARDDIHLMMSNGTRTDTDVVFGCAYDQQGMLLNSLARTDGILGLSQAKVSLPSQLASQGKINNVVGHCLSGDADYGGYMFLGDDFVPRRGMSWAPILNIPSVSSYNAEIAKMSYGNSQLSLDKLRRVIFDSGSSYSYISKTAYSDLLRSLEGVSPYLIRDALDPTLPICWRGESSIRSISGVKNYFKTLTLHFESNWWTAYSKLKIPPEGYLIISKKGNVCLGILDGSTLQDGSSIILGDISMRSQLIVYDNVKKQIGWTQSTCVKPDSIKPNSSARMKDASI
ncbi:hypothetical protein QQ045_028563 [Rhodiola kirilowii]